MPTIAYRNEIQLEGPWLLSDTDLAEAENVFAHQRETMKRRLDGETESSVTAVPGPGSANSRVSRPASGIPDLRIVVSLDGDRTVLGSSINELHHSAVLAREIPREITFALGERWSEFSLKIESGFSEARLRITAPAADPEVATFLGRARDWADTHRAPLWLRIWTKFWFLPWVMVFLLGAHLSISSTSSSADLTYYAARVAESKALLAHGITTDEVPAALGLLLEFSTLPRNPVNQSARPVIWLVIGILAAAALSFRPHLVLGLGGGRQRLGQWSKWCKLIGVTIPSLVFGTFVWPWIEKLIRLLF